MAYYYDLKHTGEPLIDSVLNQVDDAGYRYHNTECWTDADDTGDSCVSRIDAAAEASAAEIMAMRDRLASIPSPERLAALEELAAAAIRYTRAMDAYHARENDAAETWKEYNDAEAHLENTAVEFVRDIDEMDAVKEAK